MYVSMYICMYVRMYVYVRICMYMCVCVYVYVKSLSQPPCRFGPVRLLSLWGGAHVEMARSTLLAVLDVSDRSRCGAVLSLMVKEILCRVLDKEVF